MVIAPLETMLAQKNFVIGATQERVWKVLGSAIFQCLPLERMNIIDQNTFYAVLKWRLGFVSLPLNLKGKLVDISPPSSLSSVIQVKKGLIQLSLKVTFTLRQVNEGKTEVACSAMEERKQTIISRIMRGQQRNFAMNTFNAIMAQLKRAS